MHVEHEAGRDAFLGQLRALTTAATALDDRQLLAASRCSGWSLLDVLVHVHLGLQEVVRALLVVTSDAPDTDAATYWQAFSPERGRPTGEVDHAIFLHRMGGAYARPTRAVAHLDQTAEALLRAGRALPHGTVGFQSHLLGSGDFYATWAVELAVHHLDLALDDEVGRPSADSLRWTRRTVEALAGSDLPATWDDEIVALLGTGREPLTSARAAQLDPVLAARLPVLI